MKLRYYQSAAINATMAFFRSKEVGNPLIEMPTASGKSHVLAGIVQKVQDTWGEVPTLILSHNKEILEQDYQKLRIYLPDKVIGLYSSGLGMKEIQSITVAGIQSVFRKPKLFKHFKLIIIDECHLIPATGEGMYQSFLKGIGKYKLVGLTATPFRTGFGSLTDPGHIFTRTIYRIDIETLIKQKFLSPLISKAADFQMDPSKVKVTAGDYVVKQLGMAFDQNTITNKICKELVKYEKIRKNWLLFAIDIAHAEHVATELSTYGIKAMYVHSNMPIELRDEIIRLYREGSIKALVNVAVLTTGFDYPEIDMIALLRPTRSPVLHVQMIGRGSRIAPGKKDCLVLDFAGNLQRLGPVNSNFDFKVAKGGGEAPTKVCPECNEVLYLSAKECPCGYKFISSKVPDLTVTAATNQVIASHKIYNVEKVYYHRHKKKGSPDSLKVTYVCKPMQTIKEWVPFEHPFGRNRAIKWWEQHGVGPVPKTVTEALEKMNEFIRPRQLRVAKDGKYLKIIGKVFNRSKKSGT